MRPTDQHLVLVNVDKESHNVQITVRTDGDDVLDRTANLVPDERRRFALTVDEPGTYTISATVDGDETEKWSISFEEYDLEEGSDVFVEINGRPDIYWEE